MTDLPSGWAAYAHFQKKLATLGTLDDHAWGIEGALDVIFQPDFSPAVTTLDEFRRAAGTASRRERDRQTRFHEPLEENVDLPGAADHSAQVEAAETLSFINKGVADPADFTLLLRVGEGFGYKELVTQLNQPETTLRSRVLRLRRYFAHLQPVSAAVATVQSPAGLARPSA